MAKTILIVEDSLAQRFFIEKALSSEGFNIVTAPDGQQALEKLGELKPDLIISDIVMPKMDGITLTQTLKQNAHFQGIPIVLMTTLNEPNEILKIIEAGADYLFLKEFDPAALATFVNDVLQSPPSEGQEQSQRLKRIYFGTNIELASNSAQLLNLLLSTYRSALQAYQRYYQFKFELNKLQKELQSAKEKPIPRPSNNRLLKSFVNELRSPLNNILHLVDLLKASDNRQERELQAQLAALNSDHLLTILNDLQKALDYQEHNQKLPIQQTTFSLRDCVEDALSPFTVQTGEKQIDLLLHIKPQVPTFIKQDPNYLKHLLFNLFDLLFHNARQCTITLNIEANESQQELKLTIDYPKTFSLKKYLEQAKNSGKNQNAAPLPLIDFVTFCQKKLHYGFTITEKEQTNEQLEITIPYQTPEPEATQTSAPILSDNSSLRILVYSDQWMSALVLEELLHQWQFQVKAVNEASKIERLLTQAMQAQQPFQILIIDARPDNNAHFELVNQLKETFEVGLPKIILLTNFGRPGDAQRCVESGISAFLLKPVRSKELYKTIHSVLQQDASQRSLITRHSLKETETRLRILVAEDNRVNQKLMVTILKRAGFEVELAANGQEALERFKQKKFDLVLMDMQMPVMDGYTATREIRKLEATNGRHTPIFALTASNDPREIQGALNAGIDEVLQKPLNLNLLKEKLAHFQEKSAHIQGTQPQPDTSDSLVEDSA